ncbi:SPFH domain-containing protein [Cytophagaceae bacterium DM2B3-1]|uniref:SPFH domain-containing protein n=1 Tax=Xanthocytophaga flava TaxID=3048013 RepID=A0ABT7CFT7_9BACT|nr:SPFH domain-containing protein [Xanthocytophaga flavus]MDJ1491855.1 SPFH domain-containing protein [Xanthocytophaga flavus]
MTREKLYLPLSGYLMVFVELITLIAGIVLIIADFSTPPISLASLMGAFCLLAFVFILPGFFINNPNEAKVLLLFGEYKGTARREGFCWINPFFTKRHISLRARNQNGNVLKVNDKLGNPIEIGAVLVWQVQDTAKATLEVENYQQYVVIQSEAAVRHLANTFPYDDIDEHTDGITLRASADQVNNLLEKELNERLDRAGIKVLEARISHLAYAQEIAGAMLQRQQATAVVAARRQIVEGAVGMVEMALSKLSEKEIVVLDEERKAAMVSNLLVVLCGEKGTQPVLNAGTLYH